MVDRFRPKKDDSPTRKSPGKGPQGEDDSRQRMTTVGWVVVALLGFFLIQNLFQNPAEKIKMDRFLTLINDQRVTDVQIGSGTVEGTIPGGESDREVFAELPPNLEPNFLINRLERNGIDWTGRQESLWTQLLVTLLPFLVLGFLYYFFIVRRLRNQLGGQGPLSLGKNKAKLYDRTDLKTTFKDVAGVDGVETELVELMDYLKNPRKFERLGARIPKGVLLVGPPGTGKTLLARAVAGEAGVPFFYISASEFVELFLGRGGQPAGRTSRTGADAAAAAHRDGRFRAEQRGHPGRRVQPSRSPRSGS